MAFPSTLSVQKSFMYDVFLSFRGEDTRKNFVDHLYHALQNKGIITYKDDERIEKGGRISDQLVRAIEESRFHVIVFSENYASSSWCLDELVKIMDCQRTKEQIAYPVFYDVEPTEVRNQSGAVGEAVAKLVAKHQKGSWRSSLKRFSMKMKRVLKDVDLEQGDDVGKWRNAMKEAAGLAGMELKNTFNGHEAIFLKKIAEDISLKLYFFNLSDDENLVGMETRVKNVVSSLEVDHKDVRIIGIKGMGGGGKTTLARAVFYHMSILFEGKSFVENVTEVSKGPGLKELQKQVLADVLNDQSIVVTDVSNGKQMMKKMMRGRKILLVLDDVCNIDQLEALAGNRNWFKPGSRIIITTRDEQVLKACQVNFIHDVNQFLLSDEEAICLFNRYAFDKGIPVQGYKELSRTVVHYAAGLPLTIKVLGSHLCGRSEGEWVDALERLKTIPEDQTLKRLELSFNGLENDQKEIFLDVACILKGEMKDEAIRVLESCEFHAEIGLRVLEQKSLVTISNDGRLLLHDLIAEMGRNIVRRMLPNEPNKHTRLWIKEEIEDILKEDLGTEATRCLKLEYSDLHTAVIMKGLKKMKGLKYLYVDTPLGEVGNADQYLPNTLRSLHWPGYPLGCLPNTFEANKLADLTMVQSKICQLWEGGKEKNLEKLKFLDLKDSNLRRFDLEMTLYLEVLDLKKCNKKKCNKTLELHMPVTLTNLKFLNLSGSKVSNLDLGLTPHLEKLILSIKETKYLPHSICMLKHLKYLKLKSCGLLGQLPEDICKLEYLEELRLTDCSVLQDIPNNICTLKHLKYLKLKSCWLLKQLPKDIGRLESLEELHLTDCSVLQGIPNNIHRMKCLKSLHLPYCSQVGILPKELGNLECLKELNIEGTGITHLPDSIHRLKGLCIVWSKGKLKFHGFTSLKEISKYTASCYV